MTDMANPPGRSSSAPAPDARHGPVDPPPDNARPEDMLPEEAPACPFASGALERTLFDTVLDGLIVIDAQGIIRGFNRAATGIFGYAPEEAIGRNVSLLMPEPFRSEHDRYIARHAATGERRIIGIGRDVRGRRKDGSIFPVALGVNEMRIGGKRAFVGTVRDISDRKQAEEKIRHTLLALQKSNQELDEFAYIASHDLKEPLRGLSNNAAFLKEDHGHRLDDEGIRRLDRIAFLAQRMEQLVNDLLYFSRLGRQELAIQPTDMNDVVDEIRAMIDAMPHERPVRIETETPLPVVVCNRPRVVELVRNLVANAIKYNDKPERRIAIGCAPDADGCPVFHVRDNGIGIDPRFHEDIFRIFKRLNSEDDTRKGTGAGLTFARKIVERHGGRIWLDSEPGEGSCFHFTLQPPSAPAE